MTSRSHIKPPEALRYRIQEIKLQPALSKYAISLKILMDNQVVHITPVVARSSLLHWNNIPPCDVRSTSRIEIRVYEHHTFGRQRIGLLEYAIADIGVSLEISRGCNTAGLSMTVVHPTPRSDADVAAKVLSDAKATDRQKRLLDKLGLVRGVITIVLEFGGVIAELDPRAKAAFTVFTQAWGMLEKQEKCDTSIETLIDGLAAILPSIEDVKKATRLPQLRNTIEALYKLIEDASRFVIEYKSTGEAVLTLRILFAGSNAQEQIDSMLGKLRELKEALDRGISIQTLKVVDENVRRTLLKELKPVGSAQYDVARACMPGTRGTIIKDILDWAEQATEPIDSPAQMRLMWVHGQAGLGKSSIATSICQVLDNTKLLAVSFFCKRDDPECRSPQRILSTIIFGLAIRQPSYASALQEVLEEDPMLSSVPMQMQFDKLVQGVLGLPNAITSEMQQVVVLDALDECGPEDSRRQLLGLLLRFLQLVPCLKIIVTSRPNSDFKKFFGNNDPSAFSTRDIHHFDASDDIYAFIKDSIAQSGKGDLLPADTIDLLATKSSGLFIWARTACEFVLNDLDPPEALRCILDSTNSGRSSQALDELYATAIKASVGKGQRADHAKDAVQNCLGAIIACSTRKPLSVTGLSKLFGERIKEHVLQSVVEGLSSVLYIDQNLDDAVRVYHLSFEDYVRDSTRSGMFSVDFEEQNTYLAARCLRIMTSELSFNLCGLETSYKRNADVTDLKSRIARNISSHLEYSCMYWASHLIDGQKAETMTPCLDLLDLFLLKPSVIYWIEALSLLNRFDTGLSSLQILKNYYWNQGAPEPKHLREILRFMQTFSQPIRESVPHIYVSALAFLPLNTSIRTMQEQEFPNTIKIATSIERDWASWEQLMTHSDPVSAVAFSSDGCHIVSGSHDKTIRVWDADTGAPIGEPLLGHSENVASIAFSSDNRRIVSGSWDKTVRVWDADTGAPVGEPIVGHSSLVTSVALSSDGRRIVSGSEDETIRLWDANTGAPIGKPLVGHFISVTSVAFSSDDRRIVSGSSDSTIRVWDAGTGALIGEPLVGHSYSINSVAFSSDGRRIVSGSDDSTIRIWDADSGVPIGEPLLGHLSSVTSVSFSSDGCRIISGSDDKTIRVWDASTGNPIGEPYIGHSGWVRSVAFSSDSRRIASGSWDKTIRVWDAETDATISEPLVGHLGSVKSVTFSSDSRFIASGSCDDTIQVWDADTGAAVGEPLVGHLDSVNSVAFTSDGRRIVSGSSDETIRVWDIETGALIGEPFIGHSFAVNSVAFSSDDRRIVSGSDDATVRVWDANTGVLVGQPLVGHSGPVVFVAFSSDGHRIASSSNDETIRVWDVETAAPIGEPLLRNSGTNSSVALSTDGHRIISNSYYDAIQMWDANTGTPIGKAFAGHSDWVASVAFSSDDRRIVSGSHDQKIRVWDVYTGALIGKPLIGHSDSIISVAFSPNGRLIVSGSSDRTIRVWSNCDTIATKDHHTICCKAQSSSASFSDLLHIHSHLPSSMGKDQDKSNSPSVPLLQDVGHMAEYCSSDGWVSTVPGELLFWLPPEYRRPQRDDSLFVISADAWQHPVWLDFSRFKHGTDWTKVPKATEEVVAA